MHFIDSSIANFYTRGTEETRLSTGLGPLEFERNKSLISRYLKPHSKVADVGGGPGHYAAWLATLGHEVSLIDPVKKHIRSATKKAEQATATFRCLLAEARQLPLPDQSQDLVILHGPLYHLQEWSERLAALNEARRVLKKNGMLLAFAITHAASAIVALQSSLFHQDGIFSMCTKELQYGTHEPPVAFPGMLAKGFYHRPSGLQEEAEAAGFSLVALLAVEGMAWLDGQFFNSWADRKRKKRLLQLLALTESDPELLCLSPHIMLAAKVNL